MKKSLGRNKLKCLFEFHDYKIPHKTYSYILLCKHCKRFGYYKSSNGFEIWYEFDERGNRIHRKYSDGYEEWWEFDEEGNKVHWKNSYGDEVWYNKKGNMIHYKDSNGRETWYDEKGNAIKHS